MSLRHRRQLRTRCAVASRSEQDIVKGCLENTYLPIAIGVLELLANFVRRGEETFVEPFEEGRVRYAVFQTVVENARHIYYWLGHLTLFSATMGDETTEDPFINGCGCLEVMLPAQRGYRAGEVVPRLSSPTIDHHYYLERVT